MADERDVVSPDVPRRRRRAGTVAGVTAAVAAVAMTVLPVAMAGPPPVGVVQQQPQQVPGTDSAVQRWFAAREAKQIELNNALVPALRLPADRGAAAPICGRLRGAASAMLALSPVPAPQLDAPLRAGLAKFEQGAAACLRGDMAAAGRLIAEGLAERTAAQDAIDEGLEGH